MEFDGGHLLTRLFVICITYLVRHLLRSLAHLFVFLLLNFKGSLENNPLRVYILQIFFSQSVPCIPILLTGSLIEKFLILIKS